MSSVLQETAVSGPRPPPCPPPPPSAPSLPFPGEHGSEDHLGAEPRGSAGENTAGHGHYAGSSGALARPPPCPAQPSPVRHPAWRRLSPATALGATAPRPGLARPHDPHQPGHAISPHSPGARAAPLGAGPTALAAAPGRPARPGTWICPRGRLGEPGWTPGTVRQFMARTDGPTD